MRRESVRRLVELVGFAALVASTIPAGCGSGSAVVDACKTCAPPLVCARSTPARCVDPNWAEWPMPNASTDIAAGAPTPLGYTVNADGTVTDQVTGLMWQRAAPTDPYTWDDAMAYCPKLTLAGRDDWRVPAEIELVSLIDDSRFPGPTIDPTAFPGTLVGYYWADLPMAGMPDDAWLVDFNSGNVYAAGKADLLYVRCVR